VTALSFEQGDESWKKLRRRAKSDLFFFNSVILGYADLFPMREETHLAPHVFMDRKTGIPELDLAPFQLIMWPRECGKSSCGTIGSALQEACRNPDVSILIVNEKQETAQDFIASIKWHIESNQLLRSLFPEIIPPDFNKTTWSATRATVNRTRGRPESTFDCTGVGGTKVGKHFDRILCDDLVAKNAMENARSGDWSIMHQINRFVNQLPPLLSASAKPWPWIRFIGTNWWAGDSYEHIEESLTYGEKPRRFRFSTTTSTGRRVSREAYVAGDLAVLRIAGIEDGKPVFPEIWSMDRMDKLRQVDPEFFACNILNSPTAAEVRVFQDEWLRYWRFVDNDQLITYKKDDGGSKFVKVSELYKLITVDPAFSSGEEGARSAIVVLGVDMETSKMLVLETLAQRADPKDTVVDVVNAASRWGVSKVYIELAGQQLSFIQWVEREAATRGTPIHVEQLKPGGRNKDLRIESLVIPFKNADLFVHASQSVLIDDEYRKYRPGARKRDVLDALAYAVEVAPKPHLRDGTNAKQRSQQQLENFRQRYKKRFRRSYAKAEA
jgi:hypothetical protein